MSGRLRTVEVHVNDLQAAIDWWSSALPARIIHVSRTGTLVNVLLRPPRKYRCVVRLIAGPGALECYQPLVTGGAETPTDLWADLLPRQRRRCAERGRVI